MTALPARVQLCMWFALCAKPATTTRSHPVLGRTPICADCDARCDERGGAR